MTLNYSYIKIKSPLNKLRYLINDTIETHYNIYKNVMRQIELYVIPQKTIIENIKSDHAYLVIFSQVWSINFGFFAKKYLARMGNSYQNYACDLYAMNYEERIRHLAQNEIFL